MMTKPAASKTARKRHYRVSLEGFPVLLYSTGGKNPTEPALRPGAPVSSFSAAKVDGIVVAAFTEDDAKGVFCRLTGVLGTSAKKWSITLTDEATTPLDPGSPGELSSAGELAELEKKALAGDHVAAAKLANHKRLVGEVERAKAGLAALEAQLTGEAPIEDAPEAEPIDADEAAFLEHAREEYRKAKAARQTDVAERARAEAGQANEGTPDAPSANPLQAPTPEPKTEKPKKGGAR